jgi:superfamily II DNA/RNA helicase
LSFSELALNPKIQKAIEANGFTEATQVQQKAIPIALQGRDVIASAQTGTGKTAAFVLPSLERLFTPSEKPGRGPRILVLTPTRELAKQVTETIKSLSHFMRISFGTVVGGVPYPPQEKLLQRHIDILVATPGRLIDHLNQGRVDFSRLELLILDEADRMLDMGFIADVERIAKASPSDRQTLLFSATLEGEVSKIANRLTRDAETIAIASIKQRHESIQQKIHVVDDFHHKKALLAHLLDDPELTQAIIFTSTKKGADILADNLAKQGHQCAALHGDMRQSARNRTVEQLRRQKLRFLVATDVAARGLDIKGISHVINFDLPMAAEDYIHRIGRTGRGGASGIATSLVSADDWIKLKRIEKLTGNRLERHVIDGLEPKNPEPEHVDAESQHKKSFRHTGPRRPEFGQPNNRRRGDQRNAPTIKFKGGHSAQKHQQKSA